jgi:lysophospholipase L1-like esterase
MTDAVPLFPRLEAATLDVGSCDTVYARIVVRAEVRNATPHPWSGRIRIGIREVGWDGGQPEAPVAVAEAALPTLAPRETRHHEAELAVGTPFYWTEATPYRYSARIALETEDWRQEHELIFTVASQFDGVRITVLQSSPTTISSVPESKRTTPAIFVVGDSTGFSNGVNQLGWGDALARCVDGSAVAIHNRCRPGRSTRSFRREGLWERVRSEVRAGDIILLQFGHNDADDVAKNRCRGVLPGVGPETLDAPVIGGGAETVRTFGYYLRRLCREAQLVGARPVLLSPTPKNAWNGAQLAPPAHDHGEWSRAIAAELGVPFVDATARITARYEALRPERVEALFCSVSDNVHTSPAGAALNAACVAAGLRDCPALADLHDAIFPQA